MKKIYAFINSKCSFGVNVLALSEGGEVLTRHTSSSKGWAKHDIGITSDWKHKIYDEKYPEGWELIWVDDPEEKVKNDADFALAARLADADEEVESEKN